MSVAIVATALLAAYGCGSGANDASVKSGAGRAHVAPAANDNVSASGVRTVTYHGVQFDVPAAWPVHDLDADPTTCVRFDVNAVYLGRPGADMSCPADLIGRADAVLVEPADGNDTGTGTANAASADVAGSTATGLSVQVASDAASSEIDADVPSQGVAVTLTYADSDATAQQILQSFRTAGS
jgi:hypothetical protein